MKNISIRKIIYLILFLLNSGILLLVVLYFLHGSFEQFPTDEQQVKIKITMGALCLFFLSIELFLAFQLYKGKVSRKKSEFRHADNDVPVTLLASFGGLKFLPSLFAIGYNNRNPQLVFLQEGIEYRLFFKKYKKYSDIASIDIAILPGTKNLQFTFHDSVFTFIANVYDEDRLKNALIFLEKKHCSLSPKAKEFLKNS